MNTLRKRAFQLLTSLDLKTVEKLTHKIMPEYAIIKPASAGLVMLRGRIANTGNKFNVGEVLVTKCTVAVEGHTGHGYVVGSSEKMAEMIAAVDAMIQTGNYADSIRKMLNKAQKKVDKATSEKLSHVSTSKVDFYTMVRGDN